VPLVGIPLHAILGDLPALLIGGTLQPISFLFLGSPPLLLPWLSDDANWLPYAVLVGGAIFGSILSPVNMGLPIRAAIAGTGMTQEAAAVPLAVVNSIVAYLGLSLGPTVGGVIVEHYGVPALGFLLFCLTSLATSLMVSANFALLTRRPAVLESAQSTAE